jgi:iron complex outermembrane recepter protein
MYSRKMAWLGAAIGVSVASVCGGAWAQEAGPTKPAAAADKGAVEELIVTARRREESLQKVPVEVSVVTTAEIDKLVVERAQDIGNIVSGLQVTQVQSQFTESRYSNPNFTIRGQSGSTGVVVYVNEVPNFPADIFDMSGIQVLKGPQGTLFGNVTTGGAVLLQPKLPTNEFNGFVDVRAGSFNALDMEFGVGGAIIPDVLAIRVAGVSHTSTGFTHDLLNGATGDGADSQAFRVTAKLNLGEIEDVALVAYGRNADEQRLAIPLAATGTDLSGNPLATAGQIPASVAALNNISCVPSCPTYLAVAQQELARQKTLGKYSAYDNDFGQTPVTETHGFINTVKYVVNSWLTVKDIFSWSSTNVTSPGNNDVDGFSLPLVDVYIAADNGPRVYTNEINFQAQPFSTLQLTGGYYYEHDGQNNFTRTEVSQTGGILAGADVGYITLASKPESTISGFYGQGDWKILPRLTLTAGLRRTETDVIDLVAPTIFSQCIGPAGLCNAITGSGINLSSPTNTLPTQQLTIPGTAEGLVLGVVDNIPSAVRSELNAHKVTYTAAIAYEVSDDISTYLTTRTGYKPGGFNASAPVGFTSFGPELVTDWEGGIKTRWKLDDFAGTANLAIYHDDYTNIQRAESVKSSTGFISVVTANAAAARIQGFDLDVTTRYKAFDMNAYWSYTDARYTKFPNTGEFGTAPPYSTLDLTTQALAGVSKNRFGIRPSISLNELGVSEDVVLSANVYYQSSFSSQANNGIIDPLSELPGRTIFDLRADWRKVHGSNLTVSAGIQNAGNDQSLINVNDRTRTGGTALGFYQEPRTEYVEFRYAF